MPPLRRRMRCQKSSIRSRDNEISFDILTSVSRTGTNHEEDQPVHLRVDDWEKHASDQYPKFKGVENRFCPAGVYEYVEDESKDVGVRVPDQCAEVSPLIMLRRAVDVRY